MALNVSSVINFKSGYNIPWFMYDIQNRQLITSTTIPSGPIADTKEIIFSETPIAGLNYNPIQTGGFGNRKLAFTLPIVRQNDAVGNLMILKQFEQLRNQAGGVLTGGIYNDQVKFIPNPKVVYFWGSGSGVPLEYFVTKCAFSHVTTLVNRSGYPQYTNIDFELLLDESSPLYKAEEVFRKMAALGGLVTQFFDVPT